MITELGNREIYKEIDLITGEKLSIVRAIAKDMMKASFDYEMKNVNEERDFAIYFIQTICFIDGKQITFEQLENLYIDDYLMIQEIISTLLTPMKTTY